MKRAVIAAGSSGTAEAPTSTTAIVLVASTRLRPVPNMNNKYDDAGGKPEEGTSARSERKAQDEQRHTWQQPTQRTNSDKEQDRADDELASRILLKLAR